jgi:tetratricopeptide (TPR) repeat protein
LIGVVDVLASFIPTGGESDRFAEVDLVPDRVAVLPFDHAAADAAVLDIEALHSGIISELSRSPLFDVVSKSNVDREAARTGRVEDLARVLKALLVVTASVTTDSLVRVTLHVRDGATDLRLATRTYEAERTPGGLTQLRRRIVDYLSSNLVRTITILRYRREGRSEEGRRFFEAALPVIYNATSLEIDDSAVIRGLLTADSLLERAEQADRHWIAPTLLRVEVALRAASFSRLRPDSATDAWYRLAFARAEKAVERDPDNIDALETRGLTAYEVYRWLGQYERINNWAMAERALRDLQAVVVADSKRSQSLAALAHINDIFGHYHQAYVLAKQALDVDPTAARDRRIFYRIAIASLELHREREAMQWCKRANERSPDEISMKYCEIAVLAYGDSLPFDVNEAWRITKDVEASAPKQSITVPMFHMLTADVLARAGLADSARAVAARAAAAAPGSVSLTGPEAVLWTRLRDYDRAVRALELAADLDPIGIQSVLRKQVFTPLHTHPRFGRLYNRFVDERVAPR